MWHVGMHVWRSSLRTAVAAEDAGQLHDTFTRAKAARDEFAAILSERGQGQKPRN